MSFGALREKIVGAAEKGLPDVIRRNRGYVPTLIPVQVLWGGAFVGALLLSGDSEGAQVLVNWVTYAALLTAFVGTIVGGWKAASIRKVGVSLIWSVVGAATYIALAIIIVGGLLLAGKLAEIGQVLTMELAFGGGGILTFGCWGWANRKAFRWIKEWASGSTGG